MTFRTSREIPASPDEVFAAFTDPERLARWWGPAGFTSTFEVCDFRPGGQWAFVMHGPEAGHYRQESVFEEVEPGRKVVVRHDSNPKYRLVITLQAGTAGSHFAGYVHATNTDGRGQHTHIELAVAPNSSSFANAFIRLCAWRALLAFARKRSIKPCSRARSCCWWCAHLSGL